jgi:hypothetical protein
MNLISPWVGARKPLRSANKVVFPAPLGPITPTISPGRIPNDTVARARNPPKSRERFLTSSSGGWKGMGLSDRFRFTNHVPVKLVFSGGYVFKTKHNLGFMSRSFLAF